MCAYIHANIDTHTYAQEHIHTHMHPYICLLNYDMISIKLCLTTRMREMRNRFLKLWNEFSGTVKVVGEVKVV